MKNVALPIYDDDNIFYLHYTEQIVMVVSSNAAKRIVDDILLTSDEILAISVIDKKGNILPQNLKSLLKKLLE
jgi:hypothetical protein